MSFQDNLLLILSEEGVKINANGEVVDSGYNNTPNDKGGETKFGISFNYLGHSPKDLTLDDARVLYERDFWNAPGCDKVESKSKALALMLFDSCVNQGSTIGPKLLQKALGVTPDGIIGPTTLSKITIDVEEKVLLQFALNRIERYNHLALIDRTQLGFLGGWIVRVFSILNESKKLL